MGKRAWLNEAIANEYIPFLSSLNNLEDGRQQAEQFNQIIRNSWSQRGLTELSQQQSLMDITRRAIKDHLGENHFSLNYIKFSTNEYIQLNDAKQGRVALRNEQVQFLDDPDAIVGKAIALLDSPEWSEVAAGLSVLTGRRSSELLSTARFIKCSNWSVTFTGALKRRGETQILSFEIPTLAPADTICKALAKVRFSLPEAVDLDAETVNSKYGSAVIKACDRHFADLVPTREGKDNLYTHLFRSIYATIATFWFCPPNVNDVEFKAAIQGHYAILEENNPERKRSLSASRHYSDYEIADGVIARRNGKRKGVKLGNDGVQVIAAFKERAELVKIVKQQKKQLNSVRIWNTDKPLLSEIFNSLGLDESLNQQEKMGRFLQWATTQLEHSPNSLIEENHQEVIPLTSQKESQLPSASNVLQHETIETGSPIASDVPQNKPIVTGSLSCVSNTPEQSHTAQLQSSNLTEKEQDSKIDQLINAVATLVETTQQLISFSMQQTSNLSNAAPKSPTAKVKATTPTQPLEHHQMVKHEQNNDDATPNQKSQTPSDSLQNNRLITEPLEKSKTHPYSLQQDKLTIELTDHASKAVRVSQDFMNPIDHAPKTVRESQHFVNPDAQILNAAADSNSTDPQAVASNVNSDDTTRRKRSSYSPQQEAQIHSSVNRAIDAMISHNNATDLHDLKWEITLNTLKDLVAPLTTSQRLIKQAISQRENEIDAHHAQHQIQHNHNHRHKRKGTKHTINQVITIN